MQLVTDEGLTYARELDNGTEIPYWTEDHAYELDTSEVDALERVTDELHRMSMAATVRMATDNTVLTRLGLPEGTWPAIRASAENPDQWSLYGRFDLAYGDGCPVPKLLEYNADTPAGLVEAAVSQWSWLETVHPDLDQWNMLHEHLVAAWAQHLPKGDVVHLAASPNEPVEDWTTVAYLADTVTEAELQPVVINMEDIAFDEAARAFIDAGSIPQRYIATLFKMYPWEWMLDEDAGKHIAYGGLATRFVEPLHKVLTGSKALLPVLWDMYPGHPNLLPAYFEDQAGHEDMAQYVAKPMYGWEGAGVVIVRYEGIESADPRHTLDQVKVHQQYVDLPDYDGNHPVLGAWVVNGQAAGLGIRESTGLITDTHARFLPHYINAPRSSPEQIAQWTPTTERPHHAL